jgi:alpha-N-arabinofuranosidase
MPQNSLTVLFDERIATIRPELYGHFAEHLGSCVYDGLWVGEDSKIRNDGGLRLDVINALKKLSVPVLRWPGGCFADDYHWQDGIGPAKDRPRRFNAWWGHDVEDNSFGTHEFLRLCELIGAKAYLAGNVGSGTPRELKDWIEYCNFTGDTTLVRLRKTNGRAEPFDVPFWGIGNESWGCGGSMCPEDYASAFKRFSTFASTFLREPTRMPLTFIACGPSGNSLDWTDRFFKKAGNFGHDCQIHGFAAHYYARDWSNPTPPGTATEFTTDQWYQLLHLGTGVEKLIVDQRTCLDQYDPQRKIGLIVDEWGTWHPPTPGKALNHLWQQNTLRDALVAAMTLDTFNRHADKVIMANIAQVVNVLQAMVLTDGDRMLRTPTYHVFDLYQSHQGGTSVRIDVASREVKFPVADTTAAMPVVSASASVKNGQLTLSIVNLHASLPAEVEIDLRGRSIGDGSIATLTHADLAGHNTFDCPDELSPKLDRFPSLARAWIQTLPPATVIVIRGKLT